VLAQKPWGYSNSSSATCGGSLREGSNPCHVNRLGERKIVQTVSRTITMPLWTYTT